MIDDVCEWFEQYVDIATDIVELRFSDGTVKRAKRGLYMRDIEKSIRKMLIDQMADEKKQEPKWIPVSERLPEKNMECLVAVGDFNLTQTAMYSNLMGTLDHRIFYQGEYGEEDFENITQYVKAWMPLPEPYKAENE